MVRKEAGCGKCGVGNTGGGAQGHVRQAAENGLTWAGKSIIITLSPSLSALLPLFLPFPTHLPYPLFLCTYACVPLSVRSVHNYTWKSEVDIWCLLNGSPLYHLKQGSSLSLGLARSSRLSARKP